MGLGLELWTPTTPKMIKISKMTTKTLATPRMRVRVRVEDVRVRVRVKVRVKARVRDEDASNAWDETEKM